MKDIVSLAWQIIDMDERLLAQAIEIERLQNVERQYNELLNSSIEHGNKMMGNILQVLLTPGVTECFVNGSKELTHD